MIRFAITFAICFTCNIGTAMATDAVQSFGTPLRPPTKQELFDASPRGQELQAIAGMKDRDAANEAYDAYRKKYNAPTLMDVLRMQRQQQDGAAQ
jgi:hypothetical protein